MFRIEQARKCPAPKDGVTKREASSFFSVALKFHTCFNFRAQEKKDENAKLEFNIMKLKCGSRENLPHFNLIILNASLSIEVETLDLIYPRVINRGVNNEEVWLQ